MSDPQPFLDEALEIRKALADLHDRVQALLDSVGRRERQSFTRAALQSAQSRFAEAQGWIVHAENAIRSLHHLGRPS